jgi:hypothetical protein
MTKQLAQILPNFRPALAPHLKTTVIVGKAYRDFPFASIIRPTWHNGLQNNSLS